ncbi:MAG: tRNA (adenosine(37)-N6)-threonylcarbamoyltransferase complex ATPase subunit type 1 TsaE [Chitinophagales bacterium]|nr:tRNA (adenosine(37)-N6)-threonylcarbamoyltransferase complex ATPase subunit type 1 TsaE [Chitinophagales bacterium]
MEYTIHSLDELNILAKQLINQVKQERIILFEGEMGAGKTSLIKAICKEIGYSEDVTSPTYSIVNEYTNNNILIYHFDLFRLKNLEEILDIGFEEYIDSTAICLVEWPDKAMDLIDHGMKIQIKKIDVNSRKISTFNF